MSERSLPFMRKKLLIGIEYKFKMYDYILMKWGEILC